MTDQEVRSIGRVIFSFDFECGWGGIESGRWLIRERTGVYERLRSDLRDLVAELDMLEIPVVWATVGAMLSQPKHDEFDYLPNHARELVVTFLDKGAPTTRDGRDLMDTVLSARVNHEIASHSFSHTRFNFNGFNENAQTEDIKKSVDIIKKWTGKAPRSFVFPQNIITTYTPLKNNGFKVARAVTNKNSLTKNNALQRIMKQVWNIPPAVEEYSVKPGLIAHTGTLFFNWGVNKSYSVRRSIVLMQAYRALRRTAQGRGDSHFWLHPFNLSETPYLLDDFKNFLKKVAMLRDQGTIEITGMIH